MIKKLLISIVSVMVIMVIGVAIWMSIAFEYQQQQTAQALLSTDNVLVVEQPFIEFVPKQNQDKVGLIFYPGGKTAAQTFAPLMRQFAKQGIYAVITPMPLKTAFLGINKADDVIAMHPEIEHWFIAGHSLGGVAAAEYIKNNSQKLNGMLFWASYPGSDISQIDLPMISIYGDKDLQSTVAKINANKSKLTTSTIYHVIADANHWQFGHYSDELNQQSDIISRAQQQQLVLNASVNFIANTLELK